MVINLSHSSDLTPRSAPSSVTHLDVASAVDTSAHGAAGHSNFSSLMQRPPPAQTKVSIGVD